MSGTTSRASAGTSTTFFHRKPHHRLDIDTLIDRIASHFLGRCIDFSLHLFGHYLLHRLHPARSFLPRHFFLPTSRLMAPKYLTGDATAINDFLDKFDVRDFLFLSL